MFSIASNTMCNNDLFKSLKISVMHPSMTLLYKIAGEFGVRSQSALARKMVESPQTVKNWESRGISLRGAMSAQDIFGCDANELLNASDAEFSYELPPNLTHKVQEETQVYGWPFFDVSPYQYSLLTRDEKVHLEKGIRMQIRGREAAEKHVTPENKIAVS